MSWWPDAPASHLLSNPRLVVPVIGAGLSAAAGLPTSPRLAEHLIDLSDLPSTRFEEPDDLFAVADTIFRSVGADRDSLNRALAKRLDLANSPEAHPTQAHLALARIKSRIIVTFNYDLLIEKAADQQGIPYKSITHRDSELVVEYLRARHRPTLLVYHVHGSIVDPSTIVLDDTSYRTISNDLRVIRSLEYLADFTTLCFLGSRLDEPYIQASLLRLPSPQPRHVLVADEDTAAELKTGRSAVLSTRYGIVVTAFPRGEWHLLNEFATRLIAGSGESRVPPARRAKLPYRTYIEPTVRLASSDGYSELNSLLDSSFASPEKLGLWDLTRTRRALVVGSAGIGKTAILHRLAELSGTLENPVIIPLPQVSNLRGTPPEILSKWLATAAFAPSAVRGREAGRLVVLLDGLDEVDTRLQDEAAETIAALAEGFPQHRFVIGSRRIPALSILTSRGFVEFEVETDRRWANEFLSSEGRSLTWLQQRLPEAGHLGPLGSNPFILNILVRMALREGHSGPVTFSRLTAFLDEVIRRLIEREAHRLAYSVDFLYGVACELAAIQRLLGLSSVQTGAISSDRELLSNFPPALREDVLQDVARRLLVWADGDEYKFSEPLFCDHLAATYVLNRDAEAKVFVDVVMPTVRLRQGFRAPTRPVPGATQGELREYAVEVDEARRARSDLLTLIGMLVARSASWARAVWPVEPELAARSLSTDDRTIAFADRAQILWRSAAGVPASIDPAANGESLAWSRPDSRGIRTSQWLPNGIAVLQALLRRSETRPLVKVMHRILLDDSASRRARSAAVEALMDVGVLTEVELKRLISSGPLYLLSSIARVVRHRELTELVSAIVERLIGIRAHDPILETVLTELHTLSKELRCAEPLVRAMRQIKPNPSNVVYWKLFGIARMTAAPKELPQLWNLALTFPDEFLGYFGARPLVMASLGLQLGVAMDAGDVSVATSFLRKLTDFMGKMDEHSPGAVRTTAMLEVSRKGERATASPNPAVLRSRSNEHGDGIPVLFVKTELTSVVRSVMLGLGATEVPQYDSWLPPEVFAWQQQREVVDPLVELDRKLEQVGVSDQQWREGLPLVLPSWDELSKLPLGVRAAIGARVEATFLPIRPDGPDPVARLEFLGGYGPALRLEPSPSEWIALAKRRTDILVREWMHVTCPAAANMHDAFSGASPEQVCAVLAAIPPGLRSSFLDDALSALTSGDDPTDQDLSKAARAFAAAGDAGAIGSLASRFPDRATALAGWAVAAGDGSQTLLLLERMQSDAQQHRPEDYLSWQLAWIEQVAERELDWPESTTQTLIQVILSLMLHAYSDRRYLGLIAAVGTLLCSVDPMGTANYCEFIRLASEWEVLKEPFGALFSLALDRARVAGGTQRARELMDAREIRGPRELVLYEPKL